MSLAIPDGYFVDDHQIHGEVGKGGILSRGFALDFPDLSASDDQAFFDMESDIRLMLRALGAGERLQFQFYTSSDFRAPLDRYLEHTRGCSRIPIVSQVRDELVFRYRARMEAQTLIQTNCGLYLSSKLPALALTADKKKVRGFDQVMPPMKDETSHRWLRENVPGFPIYDYSDSHAMNSAISSCPFIGCCIPDQFRDHDEWLDDSDYTEELVMAGADYAERDASGTWRLKGSKWLQKEAA